VEPQQVDEMPRPTMRAQLGSPDAALGTEDGVTEAGNR
jgi:NADH-quinone oxidoreductase subunit J